jgi:hypothetical protein
MYFTGDMAAYSISSSSNLVRTRPFLFWSSILRRCTIPTVLGRFYRGSRRFAGSLASSFACGSRRVTGPWPHAPLLNRISGGFGRFYRDSRRFAVPLASSLACGSRRVRRFLAALRVRRLWRGARGSLVVTLAAEESPLAKLCGSGVFGRFWPLKTATYRERRPPICSRQAAISMASRLIGGGKSVGVGDDQIPCSWSPIHMSEIK